MGRIFWIASYPKSGNTWTRAFLANLMSGKKRALTLDELTRHTPLDSERRLYERVVPGLPEILTAEQAAAQRGPVQRLLGGEAPTTLMVKSHSAVMHWHGHPTFDMATTAGGVYIVRNPLDIVAAYAAHSGTSLDHMTGLLCSPGHVLAGSAFQAPQLIGDWSQNVESWTGRPNPALHVMRYEEMIADPAVTFGALVAFLGFKVPAGAVARALDFSSFETLRAMEDKDGFSERRDHQEHFFRSGRAGGWRDELSKAQVATMVAHHRTQMARFGYVPDGM